MGVPVGPSKVLAIISGKGSTGKTSLVAALASVAQKKILCDADGESFANLATVGQRSNKIDDQLCAGCGG